MTEIKKTIALKHQEILRYQYIIKYKEKFEKYLLDRSEEFKFRDALSSFLTYLFGSLGFESEKTKKTDYVYKQLFPALEEFAETGQSENLNRILYLGIKIFNPQASQPFNNVPKSSLYGLLTEILSGISKKQGASNIDINFYRA